MLRVDDWAPAGRKLDPNLPYLKEQDLRSFGPWVEAARKSLLRPFATSLHADAAVRGAITLHRSNEPVEAHVNRLKILKRQMYGRTGLDLPRERVLHAA